MADLAVIRDAGSVYHMPLPSRFGPFVLLWAWTAAGPRVQRLLMPVDGKATDEMFQALGDGQPSRSCAAMRGLAQRITHSLEGANVTFSLDLLALEHCSDFQQRVLRAEHAIPRGRVSTYGRIAQHLGVPGGARAVGTALATNPFPILIPCHRAVRSDGSVGGYRGGSAMKRALLVMEGLEVSPEGRVVTERFYY
ncbi:MAG: methylated-DNA--[protein]-cysteine S-methyltransferase [Anaerolineae bacterium]